MDYKRFPEEISIVPDGSAKVVGWTGKRSFVVADYSKPLSGVSVPNAFSLDGETVELEAELISLWDWCKKNELTVSEMDELQDSLETYIDIEDV